MTRVLVVSSFQNMTGSEYLTFSILRGLDRSSYEYFIACSDKAGREFFRVAKVENIRYFRVRLRIVKSSYRFVRFLKNAMNGIILSFQLFRIVRLCSISMIQVHSLGDCLKVLPCSIFMKKPIIWIVQEWFPLRKIPRFFFAFLAKFVFRFLSVSRYVSRNIRILGIPRGKIQQIPIGVQAKSETVIEDEANRRLLGVSRDQHAVCVVVKGRNRYILETLVQALRLIYMEYEHIKFFIYFSGSKEVAEVFQKFAGEILCSRLQLVVSHKIISEIIKGMDVVVQLGTRIPFSFEILEAMSSQIAVVANRSGAVPELVIDRKNGILVPPQDAKSLAKAVIELLSDKPLREQMGREGRKRIMNQFRIEDQNKVLMSVYRQVQARQRQLSPS